MFESKVNCVWLWVGFTQDQWEKFLTELAEEDFCDNWNEYWDRKALAYCLKWIFQDFSYSEFVVEDTVAMDGTLPDYFLETILNVCKQTLQNCLEITPRPDTFNAEDWMHEAESIKDGQGIVLFKDDSYIEAVYNLPRIKGNFLNEYGIAEKTFYNVLDN